MSASADYQRLARHASLTLILISVAATGFADEKTFPDGVTAQEAVNAAGKPEYIIESPSGQYKIITRCKSKSISLQDPCDEGVDTVLHFSDESKPEATLVVDIPDDYLRQSGYFFSPDERWVIRDQHLGAGTNQLTLYSIAGNGKVTRGDINKAAFRYVFKHSRCSEDKYRHFMIHFESWEMAAGLAHLNADATALDANKCANVDYELIYNLNEHRIKAAH